MTTDPSHQKDENALDQDIGSIRSAWARQTDEEPPALLDQAVMNQAKRGLEEQAKPSRKRRSIKWLGAFATASVVVLALTVVLEQEPRAPLPPAEEADGLRLDRDAPSSSARQSRLEAQPQKARTVQMADESLTKQSPLESAPLAAADDKSTENFAEARESVSEISGQEIPTAEAWIERLLELKNTRQLEQLAGELARFHSAYPDYPLPPELEEQ
jgi:hypothetical protein